jgi:very-short-patch-repair endonuclease
VIELDGGQHTAAQALAYDARRTAKLQTMGLRVLRFSNIDVLKHPEGVLSSILSQVRCR